MTARKDTETDCAETGCCAGEERSTDPAQVTSIKASVRDAYGRVARTASSCCGGNSDTTLASQSIGYSTAELGSVPEEANMGLGCGNPTAMAALKPGDTVLDLGSGGGFDCFLAAQKVGPEGQVIGVDMTFEMIERARTNARKGGYQNVEFRLGEIEHLPVADSSIDVVISNCVINLSPDKHQVFQEIYRVLKPGGRVMISDMALRRPLPDQVKESIDAYVGCIAGAVLLDDYLESVKASGLREVRIAPKEVSICMDAYTSDPTAQEILEKIEDPEEAAASVVSVYVEGRK